MTQTIVLVTLLALVCALVALPIYQTHKLKKSLAANFGRPPKTVQGLLNARRFYASLQQHRPSAGAVDDITWNDLDLDEVFGQINACHSATGDVRLYTALRRGASAEELATRKALEQLFRQNPALRLKIQYRLARLGRRDGHGLEMALFHTGALTLRRYPLFCLLAAAPFLSLFLLFINPTVALALALGFLVINANVSALSKPKTESGFASVRFLAGALGCSGHLAALLQKPQPALAAALSGCAKRFSAYRLPFSVLSASEYMEQMLGFDTLGFLLLPMVCYGFVARRLHRGLGEAEELYRLLGEVDLAVCCLSWQGCLPLYCRPTFTQEKSLTFENLYHPLLQNPVPNSAAFTGDVLLTGSNASGKSTFIKAVALNCIFAQGLGVCTASAFSLAPGRVASSMAVADSIVDGDSYFIAEIKSMRRLMQQQTFSYYFIDEILKGTNTVERVAASTAVLRQLAAQNCLCFAATHDIELTRLLDGEYRNCHFRESVTDAGVVFDYKLHEGPATSRNAILLLETMEYPPAVVATARQLVAQFEQNGEWDEPN